MGFQIENGVLKGYTEENGVTSVEIPDSVTSIDEMAFMSCNSVISVKIPENVTNIEGIAFFICDELDTITISKNAKNISESIAVQCPKLNAVNISEQNEYYTSIDGIMYDKEVKKLIFCPQAKESVTIPESVTAIGTNAFYDCKKITVIDISEHITEIGKNAFGGCKSLSTFNVSEENPNYTTLDGVLYDKQIKTLIRCPVMKKKIIIPESVTKMEQGALESCSQLEYIIIQNREILIPDGTIRSCDSLRLLQIGDYQITGKIDSISHDEIKEIIEMLQTEQFSLDILGNVKASTIANHYHRTKSKKALDFIKKNLTTFIFHILGFNDMEMLQFLTETDEIFTNVKEIDYGIDLAIERKKHEIYVMLLNYKNEHFGYTDIEKRLKL